MDGIPYVNYSAELRISDKFIRAGDLLLVQKIARLLLIPELVTAFEFPTADLYRIIRFETVPMQGAAVGIGRILHCIACRRIMQVVISGKTFESCVFIKAGNRQNRTIREGMGIVKISQR